MHTSVLHIGVLGIQSERLCQCGLLSDTHQNEWQQVIDVYELHEVGRIQFYGNRHTLPHLASAISAHHLHLPTTHYPHLAATPTRPNRSPPKPSYDIKKRIKVKTQRI